MNTGPQEFLLKMLFLIAGLLGASALSLFWTPSKVVAQRGVFMAGILMGGVGAATATMLGGIVLRYMGWPQDVDSVLGVGFLLGLVSVFALNVAANHFEKRQHMDIGEAVADTKKQLSKGRGGNKR